MNNNLASYLNALNWRYATKEFDPTKQIPKDVLDGILEAARLSASSFGLQIWKFVLVRDPVLRQKLLLQANNQRQVVDASELLVLCRPSTFTSNMIDNHIRHTAKVRGLPEDTLNGFKNYLQSWFAKPTWPVDPWLDSQLYIVLGNLLSACAVAGVDSCPMEGFSKQGFDEVLSLPEQGLKSLLVLPMGYRAETDKYGKLPKVRYAMEDLLTIK